MLFKPSFRFFEADHRVWAAIPSAGEPSEDETARVEAQAIGDWARCIFISCQTGEFDEGRLFFLCRRSSAVVPTGKCFY